MQDREIDQLRIKITKSLYNYEDLPAAERNAILNDPAACKRPQPFDYGLTRYDFVGKWELHTGKLPDNDLKYREGSRWLRWLFYWKLRANSAGALAFWLLLIGFLALSGKTQSDREVALALLTCGSLLAIFAILTGALFGNQQRRAGSALLKYQEAVRRHKLYEAAAYDANQAVLRTQRTYWESLNGYEFERATSEVLGRYDFHPRVTSGSRDGGIDIEVARAGLRGVVQCKAHIACVGPHAVRDLFGVLHHSGANFAIVISRGGFTQGARDFAKGKPVFLLDCSHLIAMQEGIDVLSEAFVQSR